jgi:hypothetical protein
MKLLSTANQKIMKGEKKGYMSFILHLAPYTLGGINTCPKATAGCIASCLNTAGRGGMFKAGETTNMIQKARIRKTEWFASDRQGFMNQLVDDIQRGINKAIKKGFIPVFRLNGTSDLSWEKYIVKDNKNIFELFPTIQFYDYTKVLNRKISHLPNYHLTFSRAESNQADVEKALAAGMNVAMVFDKTPTSYNGHWVFDGDDSDLRFLDPAGHIIGLKAKGKAKKDTSGFVINIT